MSSSLTLHHLHISQSERIVWLLEELGIPYSLRTYTRAPLLCPADLASLTSQQTAPVLTASNAVTGAEFNMSESGAIAEYLAHVHGGGRLTLPPTHENYADYLFWFHFANSTLFPAAMRKMLVVLMKAPPENPFASAIGDRVKRGLVALNARLETTGAYLAGDDLTLADIMTVWTLTTGRMWSPFGLAAYPAILAYLARIGQRQNYVRAMEKGEPGLDWKIGLTAEGPELFGPHAEVAKKMGVELANLRAD